jgi:hypothetical protein
MKRKLLYVVKCSGEVVEVKTADPQYVNLFVERWGDPTATYIKGKIFTYHFRRG